MNWLNLEIRTLRSAAYLGSSPEERATWLNVLAHCCEQENGGRMNDVQTWKDRQWQQVCGVTTREVMRATKLLTWEGGTLVVQFYPSGKEAEVKRLRAQAESAANRRWREKVMPDGMPDGIGAGIAEPMPQGNAEGERKEKGKEGEGAAPPEVSEDDASIPSESEVIAFGAGPACIPLNYCSSYHAKTTEKRMWLNGHRRLIDWKRQIVRWWAGDKATWSETTNRREEPKKKVICTL